MSNFVTFKSAFNNGYEVHLTLGIVKRDAARNRTDISWAFSIYRDATQPGGGYNSGHIVGFMFGGRTLVSQQMNFSTKALGNTLIASGVERFSHNANGSVGLTFAADAKTMLQGFPWSMPYLEAKGVFAPPPYSRVPTWPSGLTLAENNVATRRVGIQIPVATAPSDAPVTSYLLQSRIRNADNTWPDEWVSHSVPSDRRVYITPPQPFMQYQFRARATSRVAGHSAMSTTLSVTSRGSGPLVRVSGSYRTADAYVRVNGVWKPALMYVRRAGVWRTANRSAS